MSGQEPDPKLLEDHRQPFRDFRWFSTQSPVREKWWPLTGVCTCYQLNRSSTAKSLIFHFFYSLNHINSPLMFSLCYTKANHAEEAHTRDQYHLNTIAVNIFN